MAAKKTSLWIKTLLNFFMVIPSLISVATNLLVNLKNEAELARRSIILILFFCVATSILMTTLWICAMGMLLVYFLSLQLGWLLSLFLLFLLNLLLIVIMGLSITVIKNNMFFPETREILHHLTSAVRKRR
jgi:hypothetical protein